MNIKRATHHHVGHHLVLPIFLTNQRDILLSRRKFPASQGNSPSFWQLFRENTFQFGIASIASITLSLSPSPFLSFLPVVLSCLLIK